MTVAANETTIGAWKADQSASNEIDTAFGAPAGVNIAAQNLGQASAVQQSVNVQANLH